MAIGTTTAIVLGLAATAASTAVSIFSQSGGVPAAPGVPDTPLADPAETQAELDIAARRERVKRARLALVGTGIRTSPLGLAGISTQATLPVLTGQ